MSTPPPKELPVELKKRVLLNQIKQLENEIERMKIELDILSTTGKPDATK